MRIPNLFLILQAIFCVLSLPHAFAQTPNPNLKFEVATIKLAEPVPTAPRPGVAKAASTTAPDVPALRAFTLKSLVIRAFGVKENQIAAPPWLTQSDALRFDVRAKVPTGSSLADTNIMLRNLLIERFGVVLHRETREVPGYELVISKTGSKLNESDLTLTPPTASGAKLEKDPNGLPLLPAGRAGMLTARPPDGRAVISGRQQTTTQLATTLEAAIGKPVADRTGLVAKYDLVFAFDITSTTWTIAAPQSIPAGTAAAPPIAADPVPSIYAAIEKELGLRLEQRKVPVDFTVIDKAERTPTEN